jgi:hypothetical protein
LFLCVQGLREQFQGLLLAAGRRSALWIPTTLPPSDAPCQRLITGSLFSSSINSFVTFLLFWEHNQCMIPAAAMSDALHGDAELVRGALTGNRDAFAQIVARYQNLIGSIVYSGTGNQAQTQDLAQETFVIAWN